MTERQRLVLVDGNALVHRAFHAIGPLTTSRGELVNATFGFTSMLLTALQMLKPACVAVAFDMAAPTFRHRQFDAYKAQRPGMPDELAAQFVRVRQVVEALGIPIYETPGFEADDVLGTIAEQATAHGLGVTIVTGDLDALQLVNEQVTVLINRRGVQDTMLYDPAAVQERFGFPPARLPDYKALVGDSSDNIPKVPGIGEKTASSLIAQYGDLEGVLAHLGELKPRLAEALRGATQQVHQSLMLATIRRDAPVTFDADRCVLADYDRQAAVDLFQELEFRSLLAKLPASMHAIADGAEEGANPSQTVAAPTAAGQASLFPELDSTGQAASPGVDGDYHVVRTEAELATVVERLRAAAAIALDVETTAADPIRSDLVGISLAPAPAEGYYLPLGHRESGPTPNDAAAGTQLPLPQVVAALGPILNDPAVPKYAHHGKFDMTVLARHGLPVRGLTFDTMLAAYLLNTTQRLTDLAHAELGIEMTQITSLIGTGSKQISMADVPVERAAPYACADVDMTFRLVEHLEPKLRAQGVEALNRDIEVPLVGVLADMERVGVAIDASVLQGMSRVLGAQLLALEQEIVGLAGHSFNVNSPVQLGKVLFEELKLPVGFRTKTGYSTASEVMENLRGKHPIVDKVLEYRELSKLKSTYVDGLPALINPVTGRIHTSFNQTAVATGRLSSSGPNLQNIPIRTETGRQIRAAFVADQPGWALLSADYSQVELRVLAHLSRDPALMEAFLAGQDIHTTTAARVFGVPPDEITSGQRRIAKVINFGILYGMGEQAVARQGDISRQEASTFIAQYFATFPGVRDYIERTKREATQWGFVTTITGRRRQMPELQSPMREVRAQAERAAVNAPVQGSAADIIKIAMVRLHAALAERKMQSRMILQVHDELVLEGPLAEMDDLAALVRQTMEQAMELSVPLKVDVSIGLNWVAMEDVAA